jgi:hypothetical protein
MIVGGLLLFASRSLPVAPVGTGGCS